MTDLTDYGFNNFFQEQWEKESGKGLVPARVTAVHRGRHDLVCTQGACGGVLKKSAYFMGEEEMPTTGDFVLVHYNPAGDSLICKTLARKSYFSRRQPGPEPKEQAVAANFDYIFILASLNQDYNEKRLTRYLTLARQSGGQPVLLLTKSDLCEAGKQGEYAARLESEFAGVPAFSLSTKTGEGMEALAPYRGKGVSIVLMGSSGVGKSSLVNAMAGQDVMKVSGIREDDDKGRHTTVHRQLVCLPDGTLMIDTPGMRELGMWDAAEGISETFPDVEALFSHCRFSDCSHTAEPGCGIQAALQSGRLAAGRWQEYQKLQGEADAAAAEAELAKERREKKKSIAVITRKIKNKRR